ncbi:MAG: acyl-ACP--UDP-N-acetylglucosamine O-acyltransferase [Candidatus Omnitrophica bacterium]|nr:acyl-ACP--UDP-N-acetylglucosamine O-acyltransferase [Candidatus Omnitrophota bacterium]MCM8777424.1 acyl-ACP--UDP-N-acetylglucosamine O-acyltransferase [Candidatus Omnitrophota bacterium]
MARIHSTAIISSNVFIDDDETTEIGPYAIIEGSVIIHKGCNIGPYVHIQGHTEIGAGCRIFTGAIIGSIPQDLKYKGGKTYLKIGEGNTIREFVTINTGTSEGESTIIGNNNLIMAYVHIAHNCVIGNNVIIANGGTLAGHVVVDDFAIIGGLVGIHQFCRIGRYSIIGGCSKITKDIVPFVIADGHPAVPHGINKIGLKRKNFPSEKIAQIEEIYKTLFRSGLNVSEAMAELEKMDRTEEISCIIDFIKNSSRGIAR